MSRNTSSPDTIIAHADLLRAVDQLLADAERLRDKREALTRLIEPDHDKRRTPRGPSK